MITSSTPPRTFNNASILNKVKELYLSWINIAIHMQKSTRYTLGARIENKFLDLMEFAYLAYFSNKENKIEKITNCLILLDTLKFLIYTAWEGKIIAHTHYETISSKIEEVGKMFGGWKNSLNNPEKKNHAL